MLIRTAGIKVETRGLERIDPNSPYTFMFNHATAIDTFIVYGGIAQWGKGIEAAENFRIPFYGWLISAVGNYPIQRNGVAATRTGWYALAMSRSKPPERSAETLKRYAKEAKEEDFSIICAPEGGRSRDGLLGPLKSGVFKLAIDAGFPIVPVALHGVYPILPLGEWRITPQPARMLVLQPISVSDERGALHSVEHLQEQVFDALIKAGLRPRRPNPPVQCQLVDAS